MYASKVKCPHHIYTFRHKYSSVVNVAVNTTTTLQCSAPVLSSDVNIRRQRNWKRRLEKCQYSSALFTTQRRPYMHTCSYNCSISPKINFKWISYENVCILSAFGYSQRKFKLSKMRRSLSQVPLKLFITEQVIKINYMYDTLQAAVLFNVWQLPP